jgi:uncharacterized protein
MSKEFTAHRLDVRRFAEEGAALSGREPVQKHERLMAETQGRGGACAVSWSASGEIRNPGHVHPEIWLHLRAQALLPLTCQRCLAPVEIPLAIDHSFRFVVDEDMAAAQDELAEEDVLALSRSFDLVELVEDELLMEMPLAPMHEVCPEPVKLSVQDEGFDEASGRRDSAFGVLTRLKIGKSSDK